MSSTINASTASGGGLVTSADATGILQLQTAGTTALTIDGSQNVGIGTSSPSPTNASTIVPKLVTAGAGVAQGVQNVRTGGGGGGGAQLILSSTKGADANTYTALVSSEGIGTLSFNGSDGTRFIAAATITAQVDGAVTTDNVLGRLVFSTSAGGANSVLERMRIDSSGNVGIGTSSLSNSVRTVIQGSQAGGAPQTSGTAQTYGLLRLQGTTWTSALDFGNNGGNYSWIQSTDQANLSLNYSLALNPNGGNVGIGTTSPTNKLEVVGSADAGIQVTSGNNVARLILNNGGTGGRKWAFTAGNTAYSQGALYLEDLTSGGARLTVDSSGNVGIGTSSPTSKLHVEGNLTLCGYGVVQASNSTTGISILGGNQPNGINSGGQINLRGTVENRIEFLTSNNTERMRIDSSGNVGIGTTSPTCKLDVATTSSTQAKFTRTGQTAVCTIFQSSADTYLSATNSGAALILATQDVERMRIDSSGNLLFNSGYGSAATAYGCRAWVNFNGRGTVAIRASGNVSSITDNGTGDYTINFTSAMPDANYATNFSTSPNYLVNIGNFNELNATNGTAEAAPTASAVRIASLGQNTNANDPTYINLAVFR